MLLQVYGTPKQLDFVSSTARYKSFFGGRRVGKSYVFVNEAAIFLLSQSNRSMLYLTHSNSLAKEMFEKLAYHPFLKPLIDKSFRKEPYLIRFKNGSTITFRNWSNIDKIRGFKFNYVWVDEIQSFPERDFPIVEACIKDTRGKLSVSGQFNGFNWVYYRFYLQGQSPHLLNFEGTPIKDRNGQLIPNDNLYKSWHMETAEGLMFQGRLGEQELEQTKLVTPPNVYDQEYRALPTASLRAVFPHDELHACVGGATRLTAADKYSYIMGIDTAKVVDHTAVVVLECETGVVVFSKIFPNNMPYPKQAIECGLIAKNYADCMAIIDNTGTSGAAGGKQAKNPILPIFQSQIKNVRPFIWNMTAKNHLVTHLGIELRNKNILIPAEHRELIRQLEAYEYKYRGSGFLTFSAPKGDHDDAVSAILLAVWGRHHSWFNSRSKPSGFVFSGT